jgi:hypothetical protein
MRKGPEAKWTRFLDFFLVPGCKCESNATFEMEDYFQSACTYLS